jgi:regulatory protein
MQDKESPVEEALRIISRSRVSSFVLREKMKKKGYKESEIDSALTYLKESNYINDEELIEDWIKNLVEKRLYGPERIIAFLHKKGFDRDYILEEINRLYDEETFIEKARRVIEKKIKKGDLNDAKVREKAIRTLAYRGYNWDIIERVVNK